LLFCFDFFWRLILSRNQRDTERPMPKTSTELDSLKMLGAKAVADDFGCVIRTIDRWIERGVFPKEDMRIFRRRFWSAATVARVKREFMRETATRLTAAE
jgi:hypothetical protein